MDGDHEPPAKVAKMLKRLQDHYERMDIKWTWDHLEEYMMAPIRFYHDSPVTLDQLVEQVNQ